MVQVVYTIKEASSLLAVTPKTLRRWEDSGIIKPIRTVGNQRRYHLADIKKLKRHRVSIGKTAEFVAPKKQPTPSLIGEAVLKAGQTSVVLETDAVAVTSAIFITSKTKTAFPLSVTDQIDKQSFTVEMNAPAARDIKFNWWIVG
jgi:excisionase family DNA binding protein